MLAPDDALLARLVGTRCGKPVLTCIGGGDRAPNRCWPDCDALPASVRRDDFVLVHDAARPNLAHR